MRPEQALALQRAVGNRAFSRALAQSQSTDAFAAPPEVESELLAQRGHGQALAAGTQHFMEPRFGTSFDSVRIHNDPRADSLARAVQARAFTHGSDLYFRHGEYDPGSERGRHLLAHELTHVVQQTAPVARQVQRAEEEMPGTGPVASPFLDADQAERERLEANQKQFPFNRAKAERDLQELYKRVTRFIPLNTPAFLGLFPPYIEALASYDENAAHGLVNKMVGFLDARKAFSVDKRTYRNQQDTSGQVSPGLRSASAASATHVQLWSKINKFFPIEMAAQENGLTLEFTAAGKLFDGLDFGAKYATGSLLQHQWKRVSQTYVSKARGIVHARVFLGIVPSSVLTTTEWPIIRSRIEQGHVEHLVVHFYDAPGNVPLETGQVIVHNQAHWDALPKASDFPDFWDKQNRLQGREDTRHAEQKAEKREQKYTNWMQDFANADTLFSQEHAVLEPITEETT